MTQRHRARELLRWYPHPEALAEALKTRESGFCKRDSLTLDTHAPRLRLEDDGAVRMREIPTTLHATSRLLSGCNAGAQLFGAKRQDRAIREPTGYD